MISLGIAVLMSLGWWITPPDAPPIYGTWESDETGNYWLMVWPQPAPNVGILIIDPRPEPPEPEEEEKDGDGESNG